MMSASPVEIPLDGLSRICSTSTDQRAAPIPRETITRSIGWQCEHLVEASAHARSISGGGGLTLVSRPRGATAHDTAIATVSAASQLRVRRAVTMGET